MRYRIGQRWVGDGEPCYVIAEAGSNHNGSLDRAKELIDVASKAGADAVKFQGFRARTLYPKSAGQSEYLKDKRPIYDIIQEMEMPLDWIERLAEHCQAHHVDFLCTPFDESWVKSLDPHVPAFKVASYELTHQPLLRCVLACGKPTFVSTGAAQLDEVREVVRLARHWGNDQLILFQCTAAYPTPIADVNVRAMVTMRAATGCLVGLSDHTEDPVIAPVTAVALGAVAIEKHFTLSKKLEGPDHKFALEPAQLERLVAAVRDAEKALGSGTKEVREVENELRAFARRSIFSVEAILAGSTFSDINVLVLRNGTNVPGLPPAEYPGLLGRRAACDIPPDAPITAAMVEDGAEPA